MSKSKKEYIKILGRYRMFLILIFAAVILGIIEPKFLTVSNFSNIFKQIATNAILAAGMTFVILTGGIDISVGATLAFVGAVTINMIGSGVNLGITLITGLAFGAVIGAFNGYSRMTDAASANDCYIGYSVYFSGTYLYHYKRLSHST